jgi:hypothetical protein
MESEPFNRIMSEGNIPIPTLMMSGRDQGILSVRVKMVKFSIPTRVRMSSRCSPRFGEQSSPITISIFL